MSFCKKIRKNGYNLISISILILVFAILAKSIFPIVHRTIQNENEKELRFQLQEFSRAIYLYKKRHNDFPFDIKVLINEKLLRKVPENPFLKKNGFRFEKNSRNRIIRVYPSSKLKKYKNWYFTVKNKDDGLKYIFNK